MILSGSPFDCDCLVALLSVTLPGSHVCIVVRWYNKYIMYVLLCSVTCTVYVTCYFTYVALCYVAYIMLGYICNIMLHLYVMPF